MTSFGPRKVTDSPRREAALPAAPQTENQKRARQATTNRIVTALKGALNRARRHHPGMSDHAWRQLKPYGKVDVARPGHLCRRGTAARERCRLTTSAISCGPG